MTRRLAAVAILAPLSLVACDPTTPTPSPAATATAPPAPIPSSSAGARSAEPSAAVQIDEAAYLVGDAFSLPLNLGGMDWLTPSSAPVMPNGQPAVRVAFLPTSCATGDFLVQVGLGPPKDVGRQASVRASTETAPWVRGRRRSAGVRGRAGSGRTSSSATTPFPRDDPPRPSLRTVIDAPTEIELVPVFTSADATQPSLTMPSVVGLEPQSGPKKPRKATPQEVVSTTFTRATLPDGTAPDHWGFRVTGCGSGGPSFVDVTARIGGAEPDRVGQCWEGTFSTAEWSWPLPAEGTPIAVSWPAAPRSRSCRSPSSSGGATATDL